MSLSTALFSGATGLESSSLDLSVIGDNIANANTVGFKSSRATFEDALAQNLNSNSGQRGLGTKLQTVQRMVTQGSLTNTGLATDLAIDGPGLFVVHGSHSGHQGSFYTRAGQFTLDSNGYLVNLDGLRVQGYPANSTGAIQPNLGDLLVGEATTQPQPTSTIQLRANLQSDAEIPTVPFDLNDAAATSNFSVASTAYDSLGNAHQISIYFRRNGPGTWEFHAATDGGGVQGGMPGMPMEIASGSLSFDEQGRLMDQNQNTSFNPQGAVSPQSLSFSFGSGTSTGGSGLDGITQFANASSISFVNQNGYGSGELSSISIDTQGIVTGAFSNGLTRSLGQVAIADFSATDKLTRMGGNLLMQTPASGDPAIGAAGEGARGAIVAGALEQSNVDLASEFIRMITAQRNFQANSKTVTTADQLLAELMSIKR